MRTERELRDRTCQPDKFISKNIQNRNYEHARNNKLEQEVILWVPGYIP
ncbi:MAG: hypothetical protein WCP36_02435 [Methanomicrobiales archaeon]